MSQEKRKRHWGDRRDARWVKAPGLQTVMGYLLPKRTDCGGPQGKGWEAGF